GEADEDITLARAQAEDGAAVGDQRELEDMRHDNHWAVIGDLVAGLAGEDDLLAVDDHRRAGDAREGKALAAEVDGQAEDSDDDQDGPRAGAAPGSGRGPLSHTALIDWRSSSRAASIEYRAQGSSSSRSI